MTISYLVFDIFYSYTSFLAPVTSMRLHAEAHAHAFLPANSTEGKLLVVHTSEVKVHLFTLAL